MTQEIRIAAFGRRHPVRTWVVEGLPCCTYIGFSGNLNGYVRLPVSHPDLLVAQTAELMPGRPFTFSDGRPGVNYNQGYDHVDVDVPGGWTYGPDLEGWIGFDTGHVWDRWTPEDRLRFVEDDLDRRRVEFQISLEMEFPPTSWDRHWTVEALEAEVETAARVLAMRAMVAIKERERSE